MKMMTGAIPDFLLWLQMNLMLGEGGQPFCILKRLVIWVGIYIAKHVCSYT